MDNILVVDNEKSMCEFLSIMLGKEGYRVYTASNGQEALVKIKDSALDVVITDFRMPVSNGIEVLEAVNLEQPNTPVVMMTAYASAETAVEAMKKGAYDYISKPFQIEDLKLIIKNAVEKKKLSDENKYLKSALKEKYEFTNIIGKSPALIKVFDYIEKVSDSNATVLITGESGTGKELVAKAIHFNGSRKNYPFISVNCGAVPENLLESELFGYEKGAFTGADTVKSGLMEAANRGTFFLDEIVETPLNVQVKLLRVLQEKEMTPLGGTKPRKLDIRIITACNRDLEEAVKDKTFREDLFYRLNVISIRLPPLRERKEDIPLLIEFFIDKYNRLHKRNIPISKIDPDALKILEKFSWPGNVRQLENVIERAIVLEQGDTIKVSSLPEEIETGYQKDLNFIPNIDNQPVDLEKTLDQIERKLIVGALNKSDGIINRAAKMLNLSFRSMRYRVQKHNIRGKSSDN